MVEQGAAPGMGLLVGVVDDDLAVRNSLEFSLEIEGLTVRSYAGAADLLADPGPRWDCLIIDQKLAGMSGLELIAQLRQRHVSAPAILITSHPSAALRERARQAGVPIVEKPLLGNALLEMIRKVADLRGN
jgi:FixJ family two-component response regulator